MLLEMAWWDWPIERIGREMRTCARATSPPCMPGGRRTRTAQPRPESPRIAHALHTDRHARRERKPPAGVSLSSARLPLSSCPPKARVSARPAAVAF